MRIEGLGIFSNPLEGKLLMDKIKIFPVQKLSLTPEMVDKGGWEYIRHTINQASEYDNKFLPLVVPKNSIGEKHAKNHFTRVHKLLCDAEEKKELNIIGIDLGIELRIVATYRTVKEYLPYWNLAREIFKGRKLIAPGFTMISDREFNELRDFLLRCNYQPDILGIHLYGGDDGDEEKNFEYKKEMLEKVIRITDLPIALTETGQHSKVTGFWLWKKGGEEFQSKVIMRWVRHIFSIRQVIMALIYTHSNDGRYLHNKEGHFGLLREKEKRFSPKPVYDELIHFLGDLK